MSKRHPGRGGPPPRATVRRPSSSAGTQKAGPQQTGAPSPLDALRHTLRIALAAEDMAKAAEIARTIAAAVPTDREAWFILGVAEYKGKNYQAAIDAFLRARDLRDGEAGLYSNLGACYRAVGRLAEGEAAYAQAIALNPNFDAAWHNLGNLRKDNGDYPGAIEAFRKSLEINPAYATAWGNLAYALMVIGRLKESEDAARRGIGLEPSNADCWSNLGSTLSQQERMEEAAAAFREALRYRPDFSLAHSNLLFSLNYHPTLSAEEISEQYSDWNARHAVPFMPATPSYANTREPNRRLRVGYVSPDFRTHAMRFFLEPFLAAHDKAEVEIYCYSSFKGEDDMTRRYRALADHWRSTAGLTDARFEALVRQDQIDVLVDLAGHTADNRLTAFARRPAPVSLSYIIGYAATSGVSAIDCFPVDSVLAPPGSDHLFGEQTIVRLPRIPFVFQPPSDMPATQPLPALRRPDRTLVFGSFSRTVRLNRRVLSVWARLLNEIPGSRLMLNNKPFAEPASREMYLARFAELGVQADQLILTYTQPQVKTWATYAGEIDIALDPWPHNAGTTTMEALWMGVPVLTRADRPSVGRYGAAILTAAGLADWIAADDDAYIEIAKRWAGDLAALADLRAGMRARLRTSPLSDSAGLARVFERLYRGYWQGWCVGRPVTETAKLVEADLHGRGSSPSPIAVAPVPPRSEPTAAHLTVEQLVARVTALLDQASYDEAQRMITAALQQLPNHPRLNQIAAVVAHRQERFADMLPLIERAIALEPDNPGYYSNLGVAHRRLKNFDKAEAAYRRALELDPTAPDTWNNLGNMLADERRWTEAEPVLRRATELRPDYAEAWYGLGNALQHLGRLPEGEAAYHRAAELDPKNISVLSNHAALMMSQGKFAEAQILFQKALDINPTHHQSITNYGVLLMKSGYLGRAEIYCRRALELKPDYPEVLNNLAIVLHDQGRADEAFVYFKKAIALRPQYPNGHGNLLFCLNYVTDHTAEEVFAEYQRWDALNIRPRLNQTPHWDNSRDPNRRLRIGYVSPDFNIHAMRFFLMPLLEAHDRTQVELFAYAQVSNPDAMTERYRSVVDQFHFTVGLSDQQLADLIRADGIDILVDLAGHTSDNRLTMFAQRPAPISFSYIIGYAYTSGVSAIDGFFIDDVMAPPGCDHLFAEKLLRLPRIPFCFRPVENFPEVGPLPALANNGLITLGSFSRTVRINEQVIALWARILREVPNVRLILNSKPYLEPETRERFLSRFLAHGIQPDRVDLIYTQPQSVTWEAYNKIDISLDPFPHNAGTTTIESLYMGVPCVTLTDRPSVGRYGAGILTSVGLQDWIADSYDAYVAIIKRWVTDLDGLAALRAGLRARLKASSLFDADDLARCIEAGYRVFWQDWCAGRSLTARAIDRNGQTRDVGAAQSSNPPAPQLVAAPASPAAPVPTVQQILALVNAGHARAGLAAAKQALEVASADVLLLQAAGYAAYRADLAEEAVSWFERALALASSVGIRTNLGAALRQAGRLAEAETVLRQALADAPDNPLVNGNLGNLLLQLNRPGEARQAFAIACRGDVPDPELLLGQGNAAVRCGDYEAALIAFNRMLACRPGHIQGHINRVATLMELRRMDEADAGLRELEQRHPNNFSIKAVRASLLLKTERPLEAYEILRELVQDDLATRHHVGMALQALQLAGREQESRQLADVAARRGWHELASYLCARAAEAENVKAAEEQWRAGGARFPNSIDIALGLGANLLTQRRWSDAIEVYTDVLARWPESMEGLNNLGIGQLRRGYFVAASDNLSKLLRFTPNNVAARHNLAVALKEQGRIAEAVDHYRQVIAQDPTVKQARSNLLFTLNYDPRPSLAEVFAEYQAWDRDFAQPNGAAAAAVPHANGRDPGRRLRVGYLSPDLWNHSMRFFLLPLLQAHDPAQVDIAIYSDLEHPDSITAKYQALAGVWRRTAGMPDAALADLIRQDGVDILVDLTGHTARNRLLTMARRPAPVQVSYIIGYGYTSGLSAMDAFFADDRLVPPGAEAYFSEPVIRFDRIPFVFRSDQPFPPVVATPARQAGHITFGCYSRTIRLNDQVVALWARLMRAVPGSRLMLNQNGFQEPAFCAMFAARFAQHGIARDRLDLIYSTPQPAAWADYGRVDIALDPVPHNGGTTTLEALTMGVPVLSLKDRPSVGRYGAAILGALGLDDWVAEDADDFIARGVRHAGDLDALDRVRAGMRARIESSPLADAPGLARRIEAAYRDLWRSWCAGGV